MKHRLIRLFLPNGSVIFLSPCKSCPNAACLHQWMKRLCQIITTHPQSDNDNPPSSRHDGENRLVHFRKITTFRTHNNTFSKVKFETTPGRGTLHFPKDRKSKRERDKVPVRSAVAAISSYFTAYNRKLLAKNNPFLIEVKRTLGFRRNCGGEGSPSDLRSENHHRFAQAAEGTGEIRPTLTARRINTTGLENIFCFSSA